MFKQGVAVDRVVGFEELGGKDDFAHEALEARLRWGGWGAGGRLAGACMRRWRCYSGGGGQGQGQGGVCVVGRCMPGACVQCPWHTSAAGARRGALQLAGVMQPVSTTLIGASSSTGAL